MAPRDANLVHLASSLEEITDLVLTDVKDRVRFRRELYAKIDELEETLRLKPQALVPVAAPAAAAPSEGLHLSPSTLGKGLKEAARWLLPTFIALAPHFWKLLQH